MKRWHVTGWRPTSRRCAGSRTRRRTATLVAVVQSLADTAVDDAVDVFSVLMATKLIRPAERASNKQRLRVWNDLADASSTLAATGRVVLELMADTNDPVDPLDEALAWRRLMSTIQEDELASAVGVAIDVVPPGERDRHAGARKELLAKYGTVAQFLDLFAATIPFAATAAGTQILFALQNLGPSIADGQLKRSDVIESVVTGSWRPLVFGSFSKDLDARPTRCVCSKQSTAGYAAAISVCAAADAGVILEHDSLAAVYGTTPNVSSSPRCG